MNPPMSPLPLSPFLSLTGSLKIVYVSANLFSVSVGINSVGVYDKR